MTGGVAATGDGAARRAIRRERMAQLRRNKAFLAGAVILAFWLVAAALGRWIVPIDPEFTDLEFTSLPPSGRFWFGTDPLGRDVFARVIVGSRQILVMSFSATIIGTVVGVALGLLAGYFKGWFDIALMRLLEAVSAIPVIVIALLAIASLGGASVTLTVLIIGFVFAPIIARTVRAAVLGEAELDYVAAARLRTEGTPHIIFREILPNVTAPIIVEFTVRLGYAIFAVATLSFLGAGVEPGSPNWGSQVAENWQMIFSGEWWSTAAPAGAIATLAVSVNLIADGLLEAFES
ncbi:MAG: ABC transporter permease [Ilumatobacteraceae bacterium]|jgi:peptide/nickel transport system permease protein